VNHFKKIDVEFIKEKLKYIKEVFLKYEEDIIVAYLFGSFHNGKASELSDIDIAVLYNKNISMDKVNEIEGLLFKDLTEFFNTDEIDLINLNDVPITIQYGVLINKQRIYYSSKEKVIDFENHVVLNYLDIKPYHEEMNKAFIQFMSEGVING
jgi:predicted nucleotidyltransferase